MRKPSVILLIAFIAGHGVLTPWRMASGKDPVPELRARGERKIAYVRRLEPIRSVLLEHEGVVGYLTDSPVDPDNPGTAEGMYYFAQFALVPVLLQKDPDPRLTFADFKDRSLDEEVEARGMEIIRRFGARRALLEGSEH